MYEYIQGKLVEKNPAFAILDCNGVGYLLNISLNTHSQLKEGTVKLFTHLAIREDAHVFFGFFDKEEREVFRSLISVSGIGASTARIILSSLGPNEVQAAIANGEVDILKSIKGIGEKTAQRIIVDLSGKMSKPGGAFTMMQASANPAVAEALAALIALGFAKNAAEKALEKATKADGASLHAENIVKSALKYL